MLCQITATNNSPQRTQTTLALHLPGKLLADGVGVSNRTQRRGVASVVCPSRRPDSVTAEKNSIIWTWTVELPPSGTATLGFVAGDGAQSEAAETAARVGAWAAHFEAEMAKCKQVWEKRWGDAFTPGNAHFSGSLPVLQTSDAEPWHATITWAC